MRYLSAMLFSLLLAAPVFAAEVRITIPDEKVAKINHAKDLHNDREGTSLSSLEWAKFVIRRAVAREHMIERGEDNKTLAEDAQTLYQTTLEDLQIDTQSVFDEEDSGW